MIRNWTKNRGTVLLACLSVAVAVAWHNSTQAGPLQNLQELEPEPALSAPVMLPLFGLNGRRASLPLRRGQPYMLHLWATWCVPCREELPGLAAFLKAHPAMPVVPVAIDSGPPERVQAALPRLHVPGLPVWTAEREQVRPFLKSLKDPGLPMTLLIDGSGHVRAVSDGGVDWADPQAAGTVHDLLHEVE